MRRVLLAFALVSASCRSPRPAPPVHDPGCEDVRFPSAGASVLVIPSETMTRALGPVVRAACACTRGGDRLRVEAVIAPEAGIVTATVDDPVADACVQRTIDGRFAPFEIGSDCIDCGPRSHPVFRGARHEAPAPRSSRIVYPFTFLHP